MNELLVPAKRFVLQLGLLLLIYFVSRTVFTLINLQYFAGLGIGDYLKIALQALRFDISILLFLNAPYLVLLLLPLPVWNMRAWQKICNFLFIAVNTVALLFDISDWAYYPFTLKRATADVLDMIGRKGDFRNQLPHLAIDYWYVPLAAIFIVIMLILCNKKIIARTPFRKPAMNLWKALGGKTLILLVATGIGILGIRGGIQPIPIANNNAVQATNNNRFAAIVLNTPFSIVHSYENKRLEEYHFYSDAELKKYINPVKNYGGKGFRNKNVVVIILESFSKQFTGLGQRGSYTPFLDSLMQHSFVCTQAYANALHSAEGIPAVVAGIPSLMEEPFSTSIYGLNGTTSLPGLLKGKGYTTAFYHGGTNGTMSFDVFCANAGYDRYYGRSEYNNEKDYDGNWGIWDEPFLQYFEKGLSQTKQPFLATVFTLSSHDPFKVPDRYKNVFPKGPLPIQQSIGYTDMALRKFFEKAAKEPWFNNTLFVFTADHCAIMTIDNRDFGNMGFYEIPIIFYAPGDDAMVAKTDTIMQQIDILPSVMDYLHYDKPFFAFGNSIFSSAPYRHSINLNDNSYKYLFGDYLLTTRLTDVSDVYNIKTDSFCHHRLTGVVEDSVKRTAEPYFKAFLQLYRYSLMHDAMKIK